jgi:tol-pal system protein YbgF
MHRLALAVILFLVAPGVASAADKAHQQLLAEIRMLQEQQQQLQQMLGGLATTLSDSMKTLTAKLDEESGASRKGFADQKLVVDNIAEGVRVLREKADDTNVRLSSMTQELDALRQTIASLPAPLQASPSPTGAATQPPIGDPALPAGGSSAPPATAPAPAVAPPPGVSPARMYDNAFADYTAAQYDLAVLGFETFIKMFPRHDKSDDAQLGIGNSLYGAGKYRDAVVAYQKVINDYPQTDSVPAAYYKLGQTHEQLKQFDLAKKAYETLMQKHPNANEATLAQTRLANLNRKQEP